MRTVIISGGGTGIGRATARAFAQRGDEVHILGRREAMLAEAAAINAEVGRAAVHTHTADLSSASTIERVLPGLPGEVDVLVNNAGGTPAGADSSLQALERQIHDAISSDLVSAALFTEAPAARLRRPGGRVVNLTSIAALRGGGTTYGPAKAAVISLTYAQAAELGEAGITVNAVAPGYVMDTVTGQVLQVNGGALLGRG